MQLKFVPYDKKLKREQFDCGIEPLTRYLKLQVTQDVKKRVSTCYCLIDDNNTVFGYFTLANYAMSSDELPFEITKRLPKYDKLPLVMLGRLAVDNSIKGKGYGSLVLTKAIKTVLIASNIIGSIAIVVDPIDKNAEKFYDYFGFIKLPDSGRMILPLDSLKNL